MSLIIDKCLSSFPTGVRPQRLFVRPRTVLRCNPNDKSSPDTDLVADKKTVFTVAGCIRSPSLEDVRDACEACSFARSEKERRTCFEVFGLDASLVDKWLEPVMTLERTYGGSGDNSQDEVGRRMASFLMIMIGLALGVRCF